MSTAVLFVLLPAGRSFDEVLAPPPAERAPQRPRQIRSYPPADDRAHLLSLVRAGRDRLATRFARGLVLCIGGGALLGLVTAAILAGSFDMFGGLVGVAAAFGGAVGAFLGGFTAAMTGTESARAEVRELAASVRRGDVLVQVVADAAGRPFDLMVARCDELGFACRRVD